MYDTLWSRQRASRAIVASPQLGQGNWVAPFDGTGRPQEVHRRSAFGSVIFRSFAGATHFFEGLRRRAATPVTNIKTVPKNAATPATYHHV